MDPVGNYGKGLKKVFHYYKINGFSNIELKLFQGGRHEMLNEINKEEVYNYIYNWILKNILNGK
jgi:alpha-beta hydrolase superfamily lysophospholipase